MPLGARDILLILRAQDQASHVVRQAGRAFGDLDRDAMAAAQRTMAQGQALMGLGTVIGGVGVALLSFYGDAAGAAAEYNQQAALTLTQVDQLGVTLDEIKDIGRRVAAEIPAPFEQMQSALFDIFSSMDVGLDEAERLLSAFSMAAVAGQTDVQTAGRATIAIMNGFGIAAEDVNRVMDIQFQAVRKGVFTYEEFASTIGRAIPSAVRAGQSVETLSGMMAFLTRNGQSAAMAATASARAFDLISNPVFARNMRELGLSVHDAAGNFRPMVDIARDIRDRLAGMTPAEASEALRELTFGAGGTIQAMRFLNLAVGENGAQLDEMVGHMNGAAGAMGNAYDIMLEQPQSQLQLLKNNWEILKTEIGDRVIPVINRLVQVGLGILEWFRNLSPGLQDIIIKGGALAGVILTLVGGVTFLTGLFMTFSALATVTGVTLGSLAVTFGVVLAAIAAVAGAVYLIYRNWGTLVEFFDPVVEAIGRVIDGFSNTEKYLKDGADGFFQLGVRIREVVDWIRNVFVPAFTNGVNRIVDTGRRLWDEYGRDLIRALQNIWERVQGVLEEGAHIFGRAFGAIQEVVGDIVDWFQSNDIWGDIIETFRSAFEQIESLIGPFIEALQHLGNVIGDVLGVVLQIVEWHLNAIMLAWSLFGDNILAVLLTVWNLIVSTVQNAINLVVGIVRAVLQLINGEWGAAWDGIYQALKAVWDQILALITAAVNLILEPIQAFVEMVVDFFQWLYDVLIGNSIVPDLVNGVLEWFGRLLSGLADWFGALPGRILGWMADAGRWLIQKGIDIVVGLVTGLTNAIGRISEWFLALPGKILEWIGRAVMWLVQTGRDVITGLLNGITGMVGDLIAWFAGLPGRILGAIPNPASMLYNAGRAIVGGLVDGIRSMAGAVTDAVGGVLSDARDLLPFSPAKEGPFSGRGWTLYSGMSIMEALAEGITRSGPAVQRALNGVAGDASANIGASFAGATNVAGIATPVGSMAGSGNVIVQSGALQIIVEGDVTADVMPDLEALADRKLEEFAEMIVGMKRQGV